MIDVEIDQLVWHEWNVAHIARHDVAPEEVEEVCRGLPLTSETYRSRIRVIGPSANGQLLTVILALKGNNTYYPITARSASRKERVRYDTWKGGEQAA